MISVMVWIWNNKRIEGDSASQHELPDLVGKDLHDDSTEVELHVLNAPGQAILIGFRESDN